ncbi:hypothetical protein BDZ89DRAFT_1044158 [Hymenopellis radicata]|nr:hypothetical protein BDZ89DRAFT_1044158 [Hymenopellis radicata]
MFSTSHLVLASVLAGLSRAGTTVWSGSFDNYATVRIFDEWSWSNQVGEYQWVLHSGDGATSEYLALDPSYTNPASSESTGLKLTINSGAVWNGKLWSAELIPQTVGFRSTRGRQTTDQVQHRAKTWAQGLCIITSLSCARTPTLPISNMALTQHQLTCNGWSEEPASTASHSMLVPGTNFAYEIDFDGSTVGLWASTDGAELNKVVENVSASTSTNSADFHVGVLRLDVQDVVEDFYLSGVYIENGDITTSIGSGSDSAPSAVGNTSATGESTTSVAQVVSSAASYPPSSSVGASISSLAPSASGIVSSSVSSAVVTSSAPAATSSTDVGDDECDVPAAASSAVVEDGGDDEECDVYITTSTPSSTIATAPVVTTSATVVVSSSSSAALLHPHPRKLLLIMVSVEGRTGQAERRVKMAGRAQTGILTIPSLPIYLVHVPSKCFIIIPVWLPHLHSGVPPPITSRSESICLDLRHKRHRFQSGTISMATTVATLEATQSSPSPRLFHTTQDIKQAILTKWEAQEPFCLHFRVKPDTLMAVDEMLATLHGRKGLRWMPCGARDAASRTFMRVIDLTFNSFLQPAYDCCDLYDAMGSTTTRIATPNKERKEADESFYPSGSKSPSVVVEVGASEQLFELQADASWWLKSTQCQVKLVILIAITLPLSNLANDTPKIIVEHWQMVENDRGLPVPTKLYVGDWTDGVPDEGVYQIPTDAFVPDSATRTRFNLPLLISPTPTRLQHIRSSIIHGCSIDADARAGAE